MLPPDAETRESIWGYSADQKSAANSTEGKRMSELAIIRGSAAKDPPHLREVAKPQAKAS
jgi:hypothetical protein